MAFTLAYSLCQKYTNKWKTGCCGRVPISSGPIANYILCDSRKPYICNELSFPKEILRFCPRKKRIGDLSNKTEWEHNKPWSPSYYKSDLYQTCLYISEFNSHNNLHGEIPLIFSIKINWGIAVLHVINTKILIY